MSSTSRLIRIACTSTLVSSLLLLLVRPVAGPGTPAVVVVLNSRTALVGPAVLRLATRCRAKCIQLSVELRLGLDEAATIVAHWLVARIRVLREERVDGRDEDD